MWLSAQALMSILMPLISTNPNLTLFRIVRNNPFLPNPKQMLSENMQEIQSLFSDLVEKNFRVSIIVNPDAKTISFISCTQADKIKHTFPDFNIYLAHTGTKMVERVFFYD